MEVLVGPALPTHVRARSAQGSGSIVESDGGSSVKSNRVSGGGGGGREDDNKIGFYFEADRSDSSSSESSSIGVRSDDEDTNGVVSDKYGDGEEEDEVQSKPSGGLGSLEALEDSLPVKRGLSNYFAGKSKSFGNLSEVSTVKDLKKEENPLNKRRRTLLAMRMNKKSFYSWARNQPTSMPLLALAEEEEEEEEHSSYEDQQEEEEEEKQKYGQFRHSKMFAIRGPEGKFRSFQSPSCSCLTDLQEEEDDYEEE